MNTHRAKGQGLGYSEKRETHPERPSTLVNTYQAVKRKRKSHIKRNNPSQVKRKNFAKLP